MPIFTKKISQILSNEKILALVKSWLAELRRPNMYRRRFLWLAAAMVPALLLGILMYVDHSDAETFTSNNGTWSIATNLVNGKGFTACDSSYFPFCGTSNNITAMREPVPVFLMALAASILYDEEVGLIMQIVLYLASIPAIFYLLKGENIRLAVVAVLLWVFSIPVIGEINNDAGHLTAVFFYTTAMLAFMQAMRDQKTSLFILSGGLMGLAALSRTVLMGTAMSIGMIFLVMQIVVRNKKQLLNAVIYMTMIVLVIMPWVIRNKIELGSPVFGSTLTGYNIYRMNYFLGEEPFHPRYVGGAEGSVAIHKLVDNNESLTGFENEAQMNDFYSQAGRAIIIKYPLRYIELSLYRFAILWFDVSVHRAYGQKIDVLDYFAQAEQGIFLLFGLFGAFKRYKEYWPMVVTVVMGSAAYMAVNSQLRYLVDLMPCIVILVALSLPHFNATTKIRKSANELLNRPA